MGCFFVCIGTHAHGSKVTLLLRERSGSMVDCLTRDRRVPGSSLTGVTALWSLSKTHLSSSLVLVQPRKTRPYITERLLMGLKESNQTNVIVMAIMLCRITRLSGASGSLFLDRNMDSITKAKNICERVG